jgi:hypothetical protein
MTDDDQPPAASVDLDHDDADVALMHSSDARHHHIDPYAETYQAALGLRSVLREEVAPRSAIGERGVDPHALDDTLAAVLEAIREHVLEEYDHAVRWTLDPYDEMEP